MSSPSDLELMSAVRGGDLDSLRPLFERHRDRLFTFFFRMSGDPTASEDAAQDVFLRILKFRHTFRDRGRFDTWMYSIARNLLNDWGATRQRFQPVGSLEHEGPALAAVQHERLERRQQGEIVHQALQRLSAEQREVLILSRTSGLTYRELARALGCTPGAVKLRVHRALLALRVECGRLMENRDHGM